MLRFNKRGRDFYQGMLFRLGLAARSRNWSDKAGARGSADDGVAVDGCNLVTIYRTAYPYLGLK